MRISRTVFSGLVLGALASPVSAETDGNFYLGLGASSLALDSGRVPYVPTSSPGHAPKIVNGIFGYQFNQRWAADLTIGTDFSGEVGADNVLINGYRFFGDKNWRPFVSAGLSAFDVDEATDDSTQQIQAGVGLSGFLSHSVELRVSYQLFSDLGSESNFDKALGLALNWHPGRARPAAVAAAPESVPVQKEVVDTFELLVQFDFDKSDVKSVFEPQFDEIAQVLRDNPDISMTIEGHTCWIGTEQYNLGLSQRRADAVRDRFVQDYGIAADRIDPIGYGESRPIADNDTMAGRQKNRRAIAVILRPRIVTE